LEQVIVNLVINARDAMPYGGTLTISTSNEETTNEVLLTIRDTGIGMTEEIKNRIFDPFFTTKPDGQGSGLGLSTVHGIVAQSGGRVAVSTDLGHGSSFYVYLPKAAETKEGAAQNPGRNNLFVIPHKTNSAETILLAEDESELRELLATMLRTQGYRVVTARDGQDAVSVAKTHTGTIDLFLTDIIMPRKNGIEAAETIRKIRPGVSVLYMTGYAEQTVSASNENNDALLEKPVSPPVLFEKIRQILATRVNRRVGSR
jgi:CheY-like chemotaxis protein